MSSNQLTPDEAAETASMDSEAAVWATPAGGAGAIISKADGGEGLFDKEE